MIASAGGQTYINPQSQLTQPQGPRAAAATPEESPWDIPMPKDEMANVENLTSNYYNAYGTLKDFTTTMWKDYGVDVTKPDFAQSGGGDLHQAFMQMDAELRMAANDLVQHRKRTEEMAKLEAEGKSVRGTYVDPATGKTIAYDPTQMLERQFVTPEGQKISPYVATGLEDAALKAIERGSQSYYTEPDAKAANDEIAKVIKMYNDKMVADPYNREYYQRQKEAIMNATKRTPASVFPKADETGKRVALADMAKKIVKDNTGLGWTPDRVKYKYITTSQGKNQVVPIMKPEQAVDFGSEQIIEGKEKKEIPRNLDFYYMQDGKVYARFTGALADPIYDEEISNKLASEMVTSFFENNPKYGTAADASQAISPYITSETSGATVQSFLDPEEIQQGEVFKKRAIEGARQVEAKVKAEKERIKNEFTTAQQLGTGGYETFTLPVSGYDISFEGYRLKKGVELVGGGETYRKITGKETPKGLKLKDLDYNGLIKVLENLGYFDEVVNPTSASEGATVPAGKNITQAQFDQSVKEAGLSDPKDIENYKKELEASGFIIK